MQRVASASVSPSPSTFLCNTCAIAHPPPMCLCPQDFREPLYLLDKPVVLQDTRTEEEKKYPQLFRWVGDDARHTTQQGDVLTWLAQAVADERFNTLRLQAQAGGGGVECVAQPEHRAHPRLQHASACRLPHLQHGRSGCQVTPPPSECYSVSRVVL